MGVRRLAAEPSIEVAFGAVARVAPVVVDAPDDVRMLPRPCFVDVPDVLEARSFEGADDGDAGVGDGAPGDDAGGVVGDDPGDGVGEGADVDDVVGLGRVLDVPVDDGVVDVDGLGLEGFEDVGLPGLDADGLVVDGFPDGLVVDGFAEDDVVDSGRGCDALDVRVDG